MVDHPGPVHRALVWFALGFAPLAVIDMVAVKLMGDAPLHPALSALNTVAFLWILTLGYFPLVLLFSRGFRERLLPQLAGFVERDEREEAITATAARHTFLIVLALQLVFLVMSLTTVSLLRTPDGHGTLSVGLAMSSSDLDFYRYVSSTPTSPAVPGPTLQDGAQMWIVHLLPPGSALPLLILVLVQLAAFRATSRRQYEGADL